jgi:hypothetical protein
MRGFGSRAFQNDIAGANRPKSPPLSLLRARRGDLTARARVDSLPRGGRSIDGGLRTSNFPMLIPVSKLPMVFPPGNFSLPIPGQFSSSVHRTESKLLNSPINIAISHLAHFARVEAQKSRLPRSSPSSH